MNLPERKEVTFNCNRCKLQKPKKDFPTKESNQFGISRICKSCKQIEKELRELKEGDIVVYESPVGRGLHEMEFVGKSNRKGGRGTDRYVRVKPIGGEGETEVFIGYIRRK